jgi:hypothetical protein
MRIRTINELLDSAKKAQGWRFDAQLARGLGVTGGYIGHLRAGRSTATPEQISAIAELASLDAAEILLEQLYSRAESETVRRSFERALRFFRRGAAALIASWLILLAAPASAGQSGNIYAADASQRYIMRQTIEIRLHCEAELTPSPTASASLAIGRFLG